MSNDSLMSATHLPVGEKSKCVVHTRRFGGGSVVGVRNPEVDEIRTTDRHSILGTPRNHIFPMLRRTTRTYYYVIVICSWRIWRARYTFRNEKIATTACRYDNKRYVYIMVISWRSLWVNITQTASKTCDL